MKTFVSSISEVEFTDSAIQAVIDSELDNLSYTTNDGVRVLFTDEGYVPHSEEVYRTARIDVSSTGLYCDPRLIAILATKTAKELAGNDPSLLGKLVHVAFAEEVLPLFEGVNAKTAQDEEFLKGFEERLLDVFRLDGKLK